MGVARDLLLAGVIAWVSAQALAAQVVPAPILEWGPGLSARSDLFITRALSTHATPADVDGDGDIDFVQLGSWDLTGLFSVLVNDGRGNLTFRSCPPAQTTAWTANGLSVGDIDGDGDLDVVMAAFWTSANGGADRPWVHLNRGVGVFALDFSRFPSSPYYRTGCALTDVDHDGDLDVVFTGMPMPYGRLELWLNDGRGYFTEVTATQIPSGTDCASNAAVGDMDGDGFPEIVVGTTYDGLTPKRILWNDGTGRFRTQTLPPANSAYYCYLRDVDGDGDLDVFFKGGQAMLFLNEPTGLRQTLVPTPVPATAYYPAAFGHIDVDGDLDLVFAGTIFEPTVLLNDGRGTFREAPGWIHGDWRRGIETMTFADLDGDGDDDAFADSIFLVAQAGAVFFNQHRQVWGALTVPRGATYTLDVRGRRRATFALGLSGALLPQPFSLGSLGTWHIDLASMVSLGAVTVGLQGQGSVGIPIPNTPQLAGRSFYVQGFDLGTSTPRLEHATNWWGVRVQ